MPIPLSATIICKNNADTIGLTLDSLAWCSDIVVIDSGSTDATLDIIRAHPAKPRLVHRDWPGFNPQRQFAAEQCANDWILMLDADEECSPDLAKELAALSESALAQTALFKMPRKNYIAARYVRCWSPDFQTRFIHRKRIAWDPRSLPEIRTPLPAFTAGKLKSPLVHNRLTPYRSTDFADPRQIPYAHDLASHLQKKGARAGFLNLVFRPYITFLKYYILRGSFLDGRFGLVIAYKTTIGVMLKYSVLYGEEISDPPQKK